MTDKEQQQEPEKAATETPNKTLPLQIRELFAQTWDPELLISGIAIYGLLQLPDLLESLSSFIRDTVAFKSVINIGFFTDFFLPLANYILLLNFIVHFVLRSFWVGVIGLNSVCAKGIQADKLNYTASFINRIKTKYPTIEEYSISLDNLCSLIFSFTFLLTMSLISVGIVFTISFLPSVFNYTPLYLSFVKIIYLLLGIIYAIDFLTLGILKKNKIIYKIYYPIYWFYSILTLSFLYRHIYYVFISNFSKWKFGLILSLYLIGAIVIFTNRGKLHTKLYSFGHVQVTSAQLVFNSSYYGNLRPLDKKIGSIESFINSDIIKKGDYLTLFISSGEMLDMLVTQILDIDTMANSVKRDSLLLTTFSDMFTISINDSIYNDATTHLLNFRFTLQTKQRGIITYIPTSHLKNGENMLLIEMDESSGGISVNNTTYIPFWITER